MLKVSVFEGVWGAIVGSGVEGRSWVQGANISAYILTISWSEHPPSKSCINVYLVTLNPSTYCFDFPSKNSINCVVDTATGSGWRATLRTSIAFPHLE